MSANRVRIIAGRYRRRIVRFPSRPGLRPTPDRVRETLFNWLGQDLGGFTCLDLFAGSGALGFEAASRGASVVMVERDPIAYRALLDNSRMFDCGATVDVRHADALDFARSSTHTFDVIFLDPPFDSDLLARVAPHLSRITRNGGMIYAESANGVTLGDTATLHREGVAGQVTYQLFIHGHQ